MIVRLRGFFSSDQQMADFAFWAFGSNQIDKRETPHYWNIRHGDKFEISGSDSILETLPKMIQAWKKEIND